MRHILCVGMYRACSTWQYEVLSHLVETRLGGARLGFMDGDDFAASLVRGEPGRLNVLKSHDADRAFANAIDRGDAIAVYAYRDMRDVAFSFMHKAHLSFDDLLAERFLQKLISNDDFWRSRAGVLTQRYERILLDPVRGIHELARHLGLTLQDREAVRLSEEFSWERNLQRTEQIRRNAEAAGHDLSDPANTNRQDPVTLLHWNHLRRSSKTSWRDLATASQREELAFLCGDWLIANDYEPDFSWVVSPHADRPPQTSRGAGPRPMTRLFGFGHGANRTG